MKNNKHFPFKTIQEPFDFKKSLGAEKDDSCKSPFCDRLKPGFLDRISTDIKPVASRILLVRHKDNKCVIYETSNALNGKEAEKAGTKLAEYSSEVAKQKVRRAKIRGILRVLVLERKDIALPDNIQALL